MLYKYAYCAYVKRFDWGKIKLAEDFERRTNKIDIITGKGDADINKNKEERVQKQHITAWMRRRAIIYTSVIALVIIITVVAAVMIKNKVKKDDAEDPAVSGVLVIDGEIVSEEEFLFFCSMVIESDTFKQMVLSDGDNARISENVKTVAVKNAEEFICKAHEAKKLGIVLDEKEIAEIDKTIELAAQDYKNKDEYCTKYYGLSYDEYFEFRKQVMLVTKCVSAVADKADVSVENQKKVYSENEKHFANLGVKMIYFDKRGLDEQTIKDKKSNAETLTSYVKEGVDIGKLSKEHSDKNTLFDVSEHDNSELLYINSDIPSEYADIFEKIGTINAGDTMLVETENEICVVRCFEKNTFDDIVNSEKIISYVKYEYASDYFSDAFKSGKYSATLNNELYAGLDIAEYVEIAKKSYIQEAG